MPNDPTSPVPEAPQTERLEAARKELFDTAMGLYRAGEDSWEFNQLVGGWPNEVAELEAAARDDLAEQVEALLATVDAAGDFLETAAAQKHRDVTRAMYQRLRGSAAAYRTAATESTVAGSADDE